ncbi:MAG: methyltransferase domain-containing protein [Chitinophagales bacterium]|nr:methyltransferase domain-containing protein [Chitinophagales bacterium]
MKNTEEDFNCCVTTCGLPLNANYWDNQYVNGETGWDLGMVSPPIKNYLDTIGDKNCSILIPGCGNAYEAAYLVQHGFTNVTLIDISSTLVENLREQFGDAPIRILHGDFFEHQGAYDLIIEQTFFCALNPSLHERYAAKMYQLLKTGGKLVGLLFNKEFEKQGPPFGGNKADYKELFSPMFELKQMDDCTTSVKPRLGSELFIEMRKKELPENSVRLFAIGGITCSGCKKDITQNFLNLSGVDSARINTDFTEVLIVCSPTITNDDLKKAIAHDAKYTLATTTI